MVNHYFKAEDNTCIHACFLCLCWVLSRCSNPHFSYEYKYLFCECLSSSHFGCFSTVKVFVGAAGCSAKTLQRGREDFHSHAHMTLPFLLLQLNHLMANFLKLLAVIYKLWFPIFTVFFYNNNNFFNITICLLFFTPSDMPASSSSSADMDHRCLLEEY